MSGAFQGQSAVVTGAGGGIGRAITVALARQGAALHLVGRTIEGLEATRRSVGAHAPGAQIHVTDLARDDHIEALSRTLEHDSGGVSLLVHGAGVCSLGMLETAPAHQLDSQYAVNVRAAYLLTRALLPMLKASRGQIVFINSSAGLSARAGAGAYAASKHALKALADSLRDEVNPYGVRVLSVYPGRTATPMQASVHELEGKPYHPDRLLQPEDVAAVVVNALGLPPTAEVTDISIRSLAKP